MEIEAALPLLFPSIVALMHAPTRRTPSTKASHPNPALGASAVSRLGWAAVALSLLWITIFWAMS